MVLLSDKYVSQMKKGVLDMLVLKLLRSEEKYGYQIIQELRDLSDGRFLLKEGTLYPILYRLEDEKMVESKWSEAEGKRVPRKYYAITALGRDALGELSKLWLEISSSVSAIMEEKENE
ncbi:helix-turn-helix transcriptional regulator [Roseburia hominis]